MSTNDNHNNTEEDALTGKEKITAVAEELKNFLFSSKRKHKDLLSSCLDYVNRIAEAAIESDYLGLYEFCAHYQERLLLTIDKNEKKINSDVREAMESWVDIIANLSSIKNPELKLADHLNLACWGLTIPDDDVALLKSMFDFPAANDQESLEDDVELEIDDTSSIAKTGEDEANEELPEAVLELIAILSEEFEELQSQLGTIIESGYDTETDIETHSSDLKNYADMLQDYLEASESIGFKALALVCLQVKTNIVVISEAKRLLTTQESGLLREWSDCVVNYLKLVTDEDAAACLAVALIDEDWPQPLSEDNAAAMSMDLVKPDLPEFEDKAASIAVQALAEDVSIELPDDVDQELLDALLQEFPDQTEELSAAVQSLIESGHQEDIKTAQRIAHTVKGAGNTVGIPGVANIAHRLEDIFLALTKHDALPPPALAEVMVNATDCLEAMSETLTGTGDAPDNALEILQSILDWIAQIEREGFSAEAKTPARQGVTGDTTDISNDQTPTAAAKVLDQQDVEKTAEAMLRIPASLIEELIRIEGEEVILTSHVFEQVQRIKTENQTIQDKYILLQKLGGKLEELINVKDMSTPSEQQQTAADFDSMEMDQYSELHTNTHQLIETAVDIYEMGKVVSDRLMRLEEIVVDQIRLNHASQEVALQTRMLPAKTIFPRLKRAVRQVSSSTGKRVALHLSGEETLMAGDTLTELVEPLLHIIRNAIDHGIEDAEVRTELGKPDEGNIKVKFKHQGTDIVVMVEDDGSGLDLDSIRHKAVEQELLTAGEAVTEKTLISMIFRPNFSTRSETTQVSGRGIGMDAVNFSVNKMGGEINLDSVAGKGCVMEIKIPVSLISTHILLLRCGIQNIAVMLNGIEQILSAEDGELVETDEGMKLQLGDNSYPARSLASLLKIQDRRTSRRAAGPIILLRNQEGLDAIMVEKVLDSREQVVKGMGDYVPKLHGITGVTILGDGSVIPVLDLAELLRDPDLAESEYTTINEQGGFQLPTAMVVDDSLSVRRSLTQFMEDSGYKVRAARDGIEAIEILADFRPDILLVDMEMPRMNGIELSAYVRSTEEIADIPIIMITSRASAKHREEAERAGINAHVTKPFSEVALLEEIERLKVTS